MRGSTFSLAGPLAQQKLIFERENRPGFSLMLEQAPHNNVHAAIGIENKDGDSIGMASPATAARDPIFWLHHANIDRVWESWRMADQNGESRRDPAGGWRTQRHHFAALDGRRLVLPTEFGLKMRRNLGYEYDRLETIDIGPVASNEPRRDETRTREFNAGGAPPSAGSLPPDGGLGTVSATGGGFSVGSDGAAIELDKKGILRSRDFNVGPPRRTFVKLAGISADQNPATTFNIVVRLAPAGQPVREVVLGTFSLFGGMKRIARGNVMPMHHGTAGTGAKVDRIIDITEAASANPDIVFGAGKLDIRIVPAESGLKLAFKVDSISVFQE